MVEETKVLLRIIVFAIFLYNVYELLNTDPFKYE